MIESCPARFLRLCGWLAALLLLVAAPARAQVPVQGPIYMCAGSVVVFHIDGLPHSTSYRWTLPPGMTALSSVTDSVIRALAGGTGGNVQVAYSTPSGGQTSQKQTIVAQPAANRILLVVGQQPLIAGDAALKARLQGQGYIVQDILDSLADGATAGCAALVYISGSVNGNRVKSNFRDVGTPVVVGKPSLFELMGYVSAALPNSGSTVGTALTIINNTHGLSIPSPLGAQTVYSSSGNINWGRAGTGAVIIANDPATPAGVQPAHFGYEQGSVMANGQPAPARRVGLFLDADGPLHLTTIGGALLDRAICWSTRTCAAPATSLATQNLNRALFCPGDTISVNYTAVGSFGADNIFAAELSDPNGSFVSPILIGRDTSAVSGRIAARIPANTPTTYGGYKVRVTSTNPGKLGTPTAAFTISSALPPAPDSIHGPDSVCQALVATYVADSVPGALSYVWPASAQYSIVSTPATSRRVQISFASAATGANILIRAHAITNCGAGPDRTHRVRVVANFRPHIGIITAGVGACGSSIYTIPAVPYAVRYAWVLPSGATQTGQGNQIEVTYSQSGPGIVKVAVQTPCGLSDTARLNVTMVPGGKKALVYSPFATPGALEDTLRARLVYLGYQVTYMTKNSPLTLLDCQKLIVVSPGVNSTHLIARLADQGIPILACHSSSGIDQLSELKMTSAASTGITVGSAINLTNPAHPLAAGLGAGFYQVYNNSYNLGWATPPASATVVGQITTQPTHKMLFAYEAGDPMAGQVAPARRVGFFMNAATGIMNMTPVGKALFDQAVCYLANNCVPQEATIFSTPLADITKCAGDSLKVPVITRGVFDSLNRFQVELSTKTGSFALPLRLPGQRIGPRGDSIHVWLPDTLTASALYKVRVIASNPITTGAVAPGTLTIKSAKLSLSILGDTVCYGHPAHVRILLPQAGAQYQPYVNQTLLPPSLSGGPDSLVAQIPFASLTANQPDTVRFTVAVPFCPAGKPLAHYGLVYHSLPPPDLTAVLSDLSLCGQDSGTVTLASSQEGYEYRLILLNGTEISTRQQGVAGQPLGFRIPATSIAPSGSFARVQARSMGCDWYLLRDTARLQKADSLDLRVRVQVDTVCPGQDAIIRLQNAQVGIWYRLALPGSDSLRALAANGQITVSASLLGAFPHLTSRAFRILARSASCGKDTLLDSAVIVQKPSPDLSAAVSAPPQICQGQAVRLQILGGPPDFIYAFTRNGLPESATGTSRNGDTLWVDFASSNWAPGPHRLGVFVYPNGCTPTLLTDTASIRVIAGPRHDFTLSADPVCYGDSLRVWLSGTEPGLHYRLAFGGVGIGDSLLGTGGFGQLILPINIIPSGQTVIQVSASTAGCGPVFITDTASLRPIAAPTLRHPLGSYMLCPGQTSLIISDTGQPGALYQLFNSDGTVAGSTMADASGVIRLAVAIPSSPAGLRAYSAMASYGSCRSISLNDTAKILVRPAPDLTFTATGSTFCAGSTTQVNVSGSETGFSYQAITASGQPGPIVPGTGGPITLPVATPSASEVVRIRVLNAGCRDTGLIDTAFLRLVPRPGGQVQLMSTSNVCPGTDLSLRLSGLFPGNRYHLIYGDHVIDVLAGAANLSVMAGTLGLPAGLTQLVLSVDASSCFVKGTLDSIPFTILPSPDTVSHIVGSTLCAGLPVVVKVVNPIPGALYEPRISGIPAGLGTRAQSADTLRLALNSSAISHDTVYVRVATPTACDTGYLPDSARIVLLRGSTYKLAIETQDTLPCINYEGDYRVDIPRTQGIRWRIPQHTRASYSSDSLAVHLTWIDYPLRRDSLTISARFVCNGRVTATRRLHSAPDCERVYVPNIITPGTGDGNQIWDIRGLHYFPKFQLQVFNTWGAVVWQANGAYTPWDGTANGRALPSGTYYYVLQVGFGQETITGSITLFNK